MISIKNLGFSYIGAARPSLQNINLEIPDGDFLGIIGASGAGKTTLSCAINGIIPHHFQGDYYGKVMVNQKDVFETDPCTLAAEIGSVFQDIDSQMTSSVVEDEILFGLENFGLPKEEIYPRLEWALKQTGIEDLRYREISGLSGGQKQKTAIAAILAMRPKILILDEPTGELDPIASRNIFKILKEMNKTYGMTVIVIEQKIMLLSEYADHLAVMDKGTLIYHGETKEILRNSERLIELGVNCPRVVSFYNHLEKLGAIDPQKQSLCLNVQQAIQTAGSIL
ncbi:MAG: energy-coupling factor ABC transporter ATP-binding protein [Treponema sp.]|nr:energy-coupling factor ABC transporter ATP-binding protein [Treponema sp.]